MSILTGLKYVIPIFFSIGMAMSDLQVVGLQDPPKNTSHGGGDASLPAQKTQTCKIRYFKTNNPDVTLKKSFKVSYSGIIV